MPLTHSRRMPMSVFTSLAGVAAVTSEAVAAQRPRLLRTWRGSTDFEAGTSRSTTTAGSI